MIHILGDVLVKATLIYTTQNYDISQHTSYDFLIWEVPSKPSLSFHVVQVKLYILDSPHWC